MMKKGLSLGFIFLLYSQLVFGANNDTTNDYSETLNLESCSSSKYFILAGICILILLIGICKYNSHNRD